MIKIYSLKESGNIKVANNFSVKEFSCKDGSDKILIDSKLVDILQRIRTYINKPVKIISGYRTEDYNEICGGAKNSFHLKGMAADIQVENCNIYEIAIIAAFYGAKGIGIYKKQNFVHIDTRPNEFLFNGD